MVYAFLIFGKIVEKLLFKLIDVFCCLQRSLWGIVSNLREHSFFLIVNLRLCLFNVWKNWVVDVEDKIC